MKLIIGTLLLSSISLILNVPIANAAGECRFPGYIKDADGNCYLPTNEVGGESLRDRCLAIVPQRYQGICCNPPDYAASSACQEALNGQTATTERQVTLKVGEPLDVGNGWAVQAQSIDASTMSVWLVLGKDGAIKENKIVAQGEVYSYETGDAEVPRIVIAIDAVNAGATDDTVQIRLKEPITAAQDQKAADGPIYAKEPTPETQDQKAADESIYAKLASLEKQASSITPTQAVGFDGGLIPPENLKQGLGDSLPVVRLDYAVKNLKEDQAFSAEIPEGFPLEKMVLTASEPISDATVTVTMIAGSKPQLLGGGEGTTGAPDYATPRVPLGPPPQEKYALKDYFKVDAVVKEEEVHPFRDALFKWTLKGITEDDANHAKLLRYDEDTKKWKPLPTEKTARCDFKYCGFISESPGNSYFAIVVEKQPSNGAAPVFGAAIAIAALSAVYLLWRKKR